MKAEIELASQVWMMNSGFQSGMELPAWRKKLANAE